MGETTSGGNQSGQFGDALHDTPQHEAHDTVGQQQTSRASIGIGTTSSNEETSADATAETNHGDVEAVQLALDVGMAADIELGRGYFGLGVGHEARIRVDGILFDIVGVDVARGGLGVDNSHAERVLICLYVWERVQMSSKSHGNGHDSLGMATLIRSDVDHCNSVVHSNEQQRSPSLEHFAPETRVTIS